MKYSPFISEISGKETGGADWRVSMVSKDRTFHVIDEKPMYPFRYDEVMSFHEPGLAPARKGEKWFHIKSSGERAYSFLYDRVWGYYFNLAAVLSKKQAYHITIDGEAAYAARFAWVGNFQEGLCAVKFENGRFGHILPNGLPAYTKTYKYVGDFRENYAVVQLENGMHIYIDHKGNPLNGKEFLDLGVYHKGVAPAKDEQGWFHIDLNGNPKYRGRFSNVEPFYNGQARVQTIWSGIQTIDEQGKTISILSHDKISPLQQLSDLMVGYWRSQVIHSALELHIFDCLPASENSIAERTYLPSSNVHRLLRALWELGIVENIDSLWRNTEIGKLLVEGSEQNMREADLHWSILAFRAWLKLTDSIRSSVPGFVSATGEKFFDYLKTHPYDLEVYHKAMQSYANHDYEEVPSLIDFIGNEKIADVGCGYSNVLFKLLERNQNITGILFDLPEVLTGAVIPQTLENRISKITGDIFQQWPFSVDVVFMSRVLHDWNDADAKLILTRAKNAITEKGRIILLEMILSEDSPYGSLADINLMTINGGHERTLEEWKSLLSSVGLEIQSMKKLQRYGMIVEIVHK